jgi:hypothetical protein
MRVIGRRDLASGGEIQFPRGAEGELNSRETQVHKKCSQPQATDARVCAIGGKFGRGVLLWLLGVPLPIIILLAVFWH